VCVDTFNTVTCECECNDVLWTGEKEACLQKSGFYWDSRTCACRNRHKKISTRHVGDNPSQDCGYPAFIPSVRLDLLDVISYVVLGSSATLAFFLFITTWYYRRKYKRLLKQDKEENKNKYRKIAKTEESSSKKRSGAVWKHPNKSHSNNTNYPHHRSSNSAYCNGFVTQQPQIQDFRHSSKKYQDVSSTLQLDLVPGLGGLDDAGELYHEQYDEHGVKIEKPLTDAELMSRYLG